jgi:hypothetical protein
MTTAVNRNPFVFPQTETKVSKGRLILPKPRKGETPAAPVGKLQQPYVPYSAPGLKPYGDRPRARYVAPDNAMLAIAVSGLVGTLVAGLPVGLVMGPMALSRAGRVEQLMRTGKRPASDRSTVSGARICAWLSIVFSIPLMVVWIAILVMLLSVI